MTALKETKFTCDLCGAAKTVNDGDNPKGWVLVGFENPYVDRDFYEKHVCDSCTKKIVFQAGRKKYCTPCRETGAIHCSDPDNCGGPWDEHGAAATERN